MCRNDRDDEIYRKRMLKTVINIFQGFMENTDIKQK